MSQQKRSFVFFSHQNGCDFFMAWCEVVNSDNSANVFVFNVWDKGSALHLAEKHKSNIVSNIEGGSLNYVYTLIFLVSLG